MNYQRANRYKDGFGTCHSCATTSYILCSDQKLPIHMWGQYVATRTLESVLQTVKRLIVWIANCWTCCRALSLSTGPGPAFTDTRITITCYTGTWRVYLAVMETWTLVRLNAGLIMEYWWWGARFNYTVHCLVTIRMRRLNLDPEIPYAHVSLQQYYESNNLYLEVLILWLL